MHGLNNEKKKNVVISLVSVLIEERRHLIELLEKEVNGGFTQQISLSFLSEKRITGFLRADGGSESLETRRHINVVLEELWFQIEQCEFIMELLNLEESCYCCISKILSCITENTCVSDVPIICKNLSSMYSLRDFRRYQAKEVVRCLSH